jgi:hypothetical protein
MSNLRDLLYEQAPLRFGCIYALINSKNGPIEYNIGRDEFLLDHNTEYSFLVGNFNNKLKATVTIEIDGEVVGDFMLDPNSVGVYERPTTVNRKFTFVDRGSQSGREGKLHMKSVSDLGRGKLVIRQEIPSGFPSKSNFNYECDGGDDILNAECGDGIGGTVLGDKSQAIYYSVPRINTKELCVFNFRMALRPKVIPLASNTC